MDPKPHKINKSKKLSEEQKKKMLQKIHKRITLYESMKERPGPWFLFIMLAVSFVVTGLVFLFF